MVQNRGGLTLVRKYTI